MNPAFVTVGTLSGLAAGDYALSGKANVEPTILPGTATAQATLRAALPVQAIVAVPANGSVTLGCTKGGAGIEVNAQQRKLSALLVDLP